MDEVTLAKWKVRVELSTGCWRWIGSTEMKGYGVMRVGGQAGRTQKAHRLSYEHFIGPIPDGMQVDHVCHNQDVACPGGATCLHRRCVNPGHLRVATNAENTKAGHNMGKAAKREAALRTHCRHGHEFTPENTYVRPDGRGRMCRKCTVATTNAINKRRMETDPEFNRRVKEGARAYYLAHRDEILEKLHRRRAGRRAS